MKKAFSIIVLLIQAASLYALNDTLKVTPGTGSIQQAIDRASAGDVILIAPGIYKQHDITVNKSVTIKGSGYPIIDGQNQYQVFLVTAPHVDISGLQIENTGQRSMVDLAGIKIKNTHDVKIRLNNFYNTTYAVYIQKCKEVEVSGNNLSGNAKDEINGGNGIHAWQCDSLLIARNTITAHRDGIYFEFVSDSRIEGNKSFQNVRYGLHFMFSHHDVYISNIFSGNGAGVSVMFSKYMEMYDNVFSENRGDASYGILLKEISNGQIRGNKFIRNTIGIYMEGTTNIHTWQNDFEKNGWAMRVQSSCREGVFEENNFIGNTFDVATNGTEMMNTFNRNFWDKYDGYDLDRDGTGDVPYFPVSLFSVVSERMPTVMILFHSLLSRIMDQAEKLMPTVIPDMLKDNHPRMKKFNR